MTAADRELAGFGCAGTDTATVAGGTVVMNTGLLGHKAIVLDKDSFGCRVVDTASRFAECTVDVDKFDGEPHWCLWRNWLSNQLTGCASVLAVSRSHWKVSASRFSERTQVENLRWVRTPGFGTVLCKVVWTTTVKAGFGTSLGELPGNGLV